MESEVLCLNFHSFDLTNFFSMSFVTTLKFPFPVLNAVQRVRPTNFCIKKEAFFSLKTMLRNEESKIFACFLHNAVYELLLKRAIFEY